MFSVRRNNYVSISSIKYRLISFLANDLLKSKQGPRWHARDLLCNFQMHFVRDIFFFFTKLYSCEYREYASISMTRFNICLENNLAPNKQQSIAWIHVEKVSCRIEASSVVKMSRNRSSCQHDDDSNSNRPSLILARLYYEAFAKIFCCNLVDIRIYKRNIMQCIYVSLGYHAVTLFFIKCM